MLKKGLFLFVLLTGILYYGPILYDEREIATHEADSIAIQLDNEANDSIHPLPVSGFEYYIGQPIQVYEERHGSPTNIYPTEEKNSGWWIYHDNFNKFIQIEVKEGVIQSLFVLGSEVQTGSVQIGMNRDNIYDETQLSRKFDFIWNNQPVSLNLTKKEWEFFPLIQFDNGSFAMLYFHPETKGIYAVRYLSSETLINLNYYTVKGVETKQSVSRFSQTDKLIENYINATRNEKGLKLLKVSDTLHTYGVNLLQTIGTRSLTFTGLSEETIKTAESEGKKVTYSVGNEYLDAPLRYGLLQLEEYNRNLFLDPLFTAFSIVSSQDDLLFVFDLERGDTDVD